MMESNRAAKPGPRRVAAAVFDAEMQDRLLWPTVALLVLLISGGLWFGAAIALRGLIS